MIVSELEVDERSLCAGIGCAENKCKRENERIKRPAYIGRLEAQIVYKISLELFYLDEKKDDQRQERDQDKAARFGREEGDDLEYGIKCCVYMGRSCTPEEDGFNLCYGIVPAAEKTF